MSEIKTTTPTGKNIIIRYNGKFALIVDGTELIQADKASASDQMIDGKKYTVISIGKYNAACNPADRTDVYRFFSSTFAAARDARDAEIEARIPGYIALNAAYSDFGEQAQKRKAYMERLYNTSIGSGDDGNVEASDARVQALENQYPTARAYIKWINVDGASNYGYAARRAAEALYNGASLEEALAIARDYQID